IHFAQVYIVVQAPRIGCEVLLQGLKRALRSGVGRRANSRDYRDRLSITLSVVIEEEEHLILLDGTTDVAAELIIVIRALGGTDAIVFPTVGIQRLVAEKFKQRTVKGVGAALGDHVDHAAAGASSFRAKGV